MREGKTESIAFRITPDAKKCLDKLVEDSPFKSISDFFNAEIYIRFREYILRGAMAEAKEKSTLGNEPQFPEDVVNLYDVPEQFFFIFRGNKEEERSFYELWFNEFIKSESKLIHDFKILDNIDHLSSDKWKKITTFFLKFFGELKLFREALYEEFEISNKQRKEKRKVARRIQ